MRLQKERLRFFRGAGEGETPVVFGKAHEDLLQKLIFFFFSVVIPWCLDYIICKF